MLTLNAVSHRFADHLLFENLTLSVNRGDRLGLIGPNGSGKSTLLGIIAGTVIPSGGTCTLAPGHRLGYLPQGTLDIATGSLRDAVDASTGGYFTALARLNGATHDLAGPDGAGEATILRWEDAQRAFDAAGGYEMSDRLDVMFGQFRLPQDALDRPLSGLSGGERTRAGLATLLAMRPDLLLLDEPTNHLDLSGQRWLIDFVNAYSGAVIVVSHDRAFLEETTNHIAAFERGSATAVVHTGGYSDYVATRRRQQEAEFETYKRQQEKIASLQSSIDQNERTARKIEAETIDFHYRKRAAKVARAATVRRARLERMLDSEEIVSRPRHSWGLALDFPEPTTHARDVVHLDSISVARQGSQILSNISLSIQYSDRLALLGDNGAGKTTVMRVVSGELAPDSGYRKTAPGVRIGTLAQDQDTLSPDKTVLETIQSRYTASESDIRTELHKYLFGGDAVHRRVADLSWGERTRLMLAEIAIPGADVLLLDEPLNHLDMEAREEFEEALTAFPGTVLLVAHDRYAIRRIATRVLRLEDGRLLEVDVDVDPEFQLSS